MAVEAGWQVTSLMQMLVVLLLSLLLFVFSKTVGYSLSHQMNKNNNNNDNKFKKTTNESIILMGDLVFVSFVWKQIQIVETTLVHPKWQLPVLFRVYNG